MNNVNKNQRVAVWLNSIEPIFLNEKNQSRCYFLIFKNSVLANFAKENYPVRNLIFLSPKKEIAYPSFRDVIFKTDLALQLRRKKIRYVAVPHRSSKEIEQWARHNEVTLVGTPRRLQQELENKKYFDKMLKDHRVSSPKTISMEDPKKQIVYGRTYVVQGADSFGLFGTRFYRIKKKSRRPAINYRTSLVREYLAGTPVGISIFLDDRGNYFISGLRRQCFIYQNGFPKFFLGIQWLPSNFFSELTNRKISAEIKKLVDLLIAVNFSGVANVDLLIYRNIPHILECNPRLSASTPQIFSFPELTAGKNSWQFYLNTFQKKNNVRTKSVKLPKHTFKGSLLDIDLPAKTKIKNVLPIGAYKIKNNRVTFVSQFVKDFLNNKEYIFLFHELSSKKIITRNFTLATLISNVPLFNIHTGKLNRKGEKLVTHFKKEFLSK